LKIDQSFLQDIGVGSGGSQLFETIVSLAHSMGLSVTAEGVETPEQFQLVRQAGCDRVQGHLFGGPLLAEGVEERMVRGFNLADGIGA
jgi:EAL domain-containing protein (putative c-di-GMP-specific phosphodiesterase class I)